MLKRKIFKLLKFNYKCQISFIRRQNNIPSIFDHAREFYFNGLLTILILTRNLGPILQTCAYITYILINIRQLTCFHLGKSYKYISATGDS